MALTVIIKDPQTGGHDHPEMVFDPAPRLGGGDTSFVIENRTDQTVVLYFEWFNQREKKVKRTERLIPPYSGPHLLPFNYQKSDEDWGSLINIGVMWVWNKYTNADEYFWLHPVSSSPGQHHTTPIIIE